MRVYSQGQDASCWVSLLTIFPCLFAAPDMTWWCASEDDLELGMRVLDTD